MSKPFIICRIQLSTLILLSLLMIASSAFAEVPVRMTQQGRLLTVDGEPMQGAKTLLFELYDAATDGEIMWGSEFEVDLGDSGFYTVILGSDDNPLDHTVFQEGSTFMQLTIDNKPLLPRLELTSVPYAQIAKFARTAGHADTAGSADSVKDGSITTSAIADKAVTADKLDSIPWSKISDQPTIPTYTGADFVTSNQNCATAGQMVIGISASGTLVCETPVDNNTTYTAGSGLVLNNSRFSIASGGVTDDNIVDMSWTKITGRPEITTFASSDFAKSNQSCSGTDVVLGFNANGTVNCGPPKDTTYTAEPNQGLSINNNQFGIATQGINPDHIAPGAIRTGHLANGTITPDKIKNALPIYAVTNSYCAESIGALSFSTYCMADQESTAAPCSLCGNSTIGGTLYNGYRTCTGGCSCISANAECPNSKVGYIISDSSP